MDNLKGIVSSSGKLSAAVSTEVVLEGITASPYIGPQGPKGDKGDKGAKGDKGDQGLKGDTGESGVEINIQEPTNEEVRVWINPDGSADLNIATEEYVNDAIANIESSGANFATFDIDSTTGELIMTSDSKITSPIFGLNIDGELEVEFK